jgi:hypothetical protein
MIGLRRWLAFQVLDRRIPMPRRKLRRGYTPDPDYRNWIRQFPCCACGRLQGIEAAHTGPHALSQKGSDRSCVPLCERCHRTGRHALHRIGPVNFQAVWQINFLGIVAEMNQEWRQR